MAPNRLDHALHHPHAAHGETGASPAPGGEGADLRLASLSIRARALLLMAVVAIPYTAFQIYAGLRAYDTTLRNAEDRVVAVAAATASALEQFLSIAERSTGSLAERLGPTLLTASGCEDRMGPLRDAFPYFANLLVVDATGTLVCSAQSREGNEPISAADRAWFQRVRDQRGFSVGRPVVGPITGEWVVATGSPILGPDSTFLGAVAGTVALLRLEELLEGRAPRANELVTITTNDAVVMARSVDAEYWVGRGLPSGTVEVERRGSREFVTRTADASGLARIWGRVDLPEFALRVYVGVPTDRVTAPSRAILRTEAVVSLLALGAAFLVATLLFRGISQSMALLADGVRAAARGTRVIVPPGAPREVRAVVSQLNHALQERQRAEEAERVARERINHIHENAVFGMCVFSPDGHLRQVNRALVQMLGYETPEELLEADPQSIWRSSTEPDAMWKRVRDKGLVEDYEVDLLQRDGQPVMVRLNGRRRDLPDEGPALEVIVEDITEQRALEELARHQQKMEAVGRLAGGVAHEFNNLLTVLGVNSELISTALGPDHELSQEAREIDVALGHARRLTRKLLTFSRKEVTQPELLDVNAAATEMEGTLRRVLGELVRLETEMARSVARVWFDRGHLEQVVLNLVLNARDALGTDQGTIRISTRTAAAAFSLDESAAVRGPVRWYVVLTVADDGPGMPPEVRELIFEPFFTTKPPGVGTGLGLPTVYGIVSEAGGRIEVSTIPGQGTSFEVWLPVAETEVDTDGPIVVASGDRAVLLAAESPPLRSLTRDALEEAGYRVLEASSSVDALDAFWRHGAPLSLVVTTPLLSNISGEPLMDRLRREQPVLPALYLSDGADLPTRPDEGVLEIPFGVRGLSRAVARLIESTAHAYPGPSRDR